MQGATLRLSGDGSGCSETIGALTFSNAADTVILTPAGSNHAVLTATSVVTGTGLATIQRVDGGGSGTGRLMVSAGLSDGQYLSWAQVIEGGVTAPAQYTTAQGIVAQGTAVWYTRQSGNWDDQATWRDGVSGTPISTDEVEIRGHAVSLNSVGRTCAALSLTTASGSVTAVSGESLTVTSGNCCVQGAITGTVSSAAVMSDTANRWFATTAGGQLVLGGAVSGLGTVRIGGAGVVSLGGSNSFSGAVTVASGILRCAANHVLADGITISVASKATFDLAGCTDTIAAAALPSGANLALGSGTLSVFGDNSSPTWSGTISGAGTLRKIGSGTLTLGSTRGAWTGGVAVDDGVVTLTAAQAVGTGTSTVATSKTLNANLANCLNGSTVTVSGTLTTSTASALNAATVNIPSGGTANVNGANCLNAGTVNVATGGSLTATVASALASGTVNLTGGTLRLINNAATAFAGTVVVATSGSTVLVDRAPRSSIRLASSPSTPHR